LQEQDYDDEQALKREEAQERKVEMRRDSCAPQAAASGTDVTEVEGGAAG
jgi:hypothetical protein